MARKCKKHNLSDKDYIELYQRHEELGRDTTIADMAKGMGVSRQTLSAWIQKGRILADSKRDTASEKNKVKLALLEMPEFPDEDSPTIELVEAAQKRFEKRKESFDAHTWFPVKVKSREPLGVMWFGDPHLDDNGCDWTTLRRDVDICQHTPGMFGANCGDTTNNWSGRLMRLYAEQDASVKTARKFAEWFMLETVAWMVWILGNHDAWGDGSTVLMEMAKRHKTQKLVLHDWEVRFSLKFPGGWEPRIYCAHNFKGTSIYNPMHGPMREGLMGDEADLYVCGDRHTAGFYSNENPSRGWQHFLRVRGYKFQDDYARRNGYKEQREGCASVTVFDPYRERITVFQDTQEGADYLTMLRARYE